MLALGDQGVGRRTGVATTISGLVRKVAACACRDKPPTTRASLMSVNCARLVSIACTCRGIVPFELRLGDDDNLLVFTIILIFSVSAPERPAHG